MTTAVEFFSGIPNDDGLTPAWVLNASDMELERRHDWVQWAFPLAVPSQFNPDAPLVSAEIMRSLPDPARTMFFDMMTRYVRFLASTRHWRRPGDHNHLRITRLLTALRLAGMDQRAEEIYRFVCLKGCPAIETRRYWAEVMGLEPS